MSLIGEKKVHSIPSDGDMKKKDSFVDVKNLREVKEVAELVEQLQTMARAVGDDPEVVVKVSEKGNTWSYAFHPHNEITIPLRDLIDKGIEYCFAVICHEGGHCRVSKIDFIPREEVWKQMGFPFLYNVIEDPRDNNWVQGKYQGARKWQKRLYDHHFPADKIAEKVTETLGYVPKHIEFGNEIIYYWHNGTFSPGVDPAIRDDLMDCKRHWENAYNTLPPINDPTDEEIMMAAKKSYDIFYKNVWPIYKKYVDEAKEQEAMKQMAKDQQEKKEKGEGEPGEPQDGEGEPGEPQEGKGEPGGQPPTDFSDWPSDPGTGEPMPLDQMDRKTRKEMEKKIREFLEGMSKEDREKYIKEMEKKAEDKLDEAEHEANKELKGEMVDQPEDRHEEKERKKKEAEEQAKQKELQDKADKIAEEREKEKTPYEKAYEEVAPYIDDVADVLIDMLMKKVFPEYEAKFPGQRLRLKQAMQFEATKDPTDLFETRLPAEEPEFVIGLLVDLSGSMSQDNKIQNAFKGTVLFTEALRRVQDVTGRVKLCVYGFQREITMFKGFDTEINDDCRDEISKIVPLCGSDNNDAWAVYQLSKLLEEQSGDERFLIVISDGEPVHSDESKIKKYSHLNNPPEELKAVIRDVSNEGIVNLLGLGFGSGTDHVANYYDSDLPGVENKPNVAVEDLAKVLKEKIINIFSNK